MTENAPSPVIRNYPDAPVPTRWTKAARQNPLIQFPKFLMAAANIMMMVIKGHKD